MVIQHDGRKRRFPDVFVKSACVSLELLATCSNQEPVSWDVTVMVMTAQYSTGVQYTLQYCSAAQNTAAAASVSGTIRVTLTITS